MNWPQILLVLGLALVGALAWAGCQYQLHRSDREMGVADTQGRDDFDGVNPKAARRDGDWMDECGACKVCDGEIPHGHTDNCDIYKLEREIARLRQALRVMADTQGRDDFDDSKPNDGKEA